MRISLLCLVCLFAMHHRAFAQLSVDVQIIPDPSLPPPTLTSDTFTGLPAIPTVTDQYTDTQLTIEQCPKGTYSTMGTINGISTQTCAPCPAGTASNTAGASSLSACLPCIQGTYSGAGASMCIGCPTNTFSVTPQAQSITSCIACPDNTTSPSASDSIDKCVCNSGLFPSDNLMDSFPYDLSPIAISLSGVAELDYAHVAC